jgi:hypothetical protein
MTGFGAEPPTVPAHTRIPAGEPGTERKEQIVTAFAEGGVDATFTSVGEDWGITGERVRQIVVEWEARTGERISRTPDRRRAARLEAKEARKKLRPPTVAQRLAVYVRPVPGTDCWEWIGPLTYPGGRPYPRFRAFGEQFAHRVAYRTWCVDQSRRITSSSKPVTARSASIRSTCSRSTAPAPFALGEETSTRPR